MFFINGIDIDYRKNRIDTGVNIFKIPNTIEHRATI